MVKAPSAYCINYIIKFLRLPRLLYAWLPFFLLGIAHAGVGMVKFKDEGELIFNGGRVVKAAGILGSGGLVILEEGVWQVGAKTITVSAGKETDLGRIQTAGSHSFDVPIQQPRSRTLKVDALPDQQWRLAGENAWRQGSATVMTCGGSHRLEWKEGELVIGRLISMSEVTPSDFKLPVRIKIQPPLANAGAGTWITSTTRNGMSQPGNVAVLRDVNGKVVAWQKLGSLATDTLSDRVGADMPLLSLDKIAEMVEPEDSMPKTLRTGSSKALKAWEIVKNEGRDYVTADSVRDFYNPLYGFTTFRLQGNHFWLGSSELILKATIGSQEMFINNIKFILSFPVTESNGKVLFSRLDLCKLIDPVLCPNHIQNAEDFDTVVVDAGHGGHDAGARGICGDEKDFALKMAMSVRTALIKRDFKVVMTRDDDSFLTDAERAKIANETPKSICISLQFSTGSSEITGIETLVQAPKSVADNRVLNGNKHDSGNIALATAVHASVISRFKFVDCGIKRAELAVLNSCKRPSIVFKGGFVSNEKECLLIASDEYRKQVSAAIGDAVMNYRKMLERR